MLDRPLGQRIAVAMSLAASANCALVARPMLAVSTLPPKIEALRGPWPRSGAAGDDRDQRYGGQCGPEAVRLGHDYPPVLVQALFLRGAFSAIASSSGMACSSWSSASVTSCWAERPLTAQARRSFRWRAGSSRSVNAALPLLPGAARGRRDGPEPAAARAERRATGAGSAGSTSAAQPELGRGVLGFRIVELGGLVDIFAVLVLAVLVVGGEALGDFGLLVVDRRGDRSQRGDRVAQRLVGQLLAERVMIVVAERGERRLGRFEAHVVPAEILEAAAAIWPKPWGRIAGRAAPLRASRPEESDAKALGSLIARHSLLADHAAAEATDWTRAGGTDAGRLVRRGEHGAAEILFEPVGDIIPQLGHFAGRAAVGIDFHHRAAVDHRGGEIGAVVERDRGDGAVLRQRDRGFIGDLGLGRRAR